MRGRALVSCPNILERASTHKQHGMPSTLTPKWQIGNTLLAGMGGWRHNPPTAEGEADVSCETPRAVAEHKRRTPLFSNIWHDEPLRIRRNLKRSYRGLSRCNFVYLYPKTTWNYACIVCDPTYGHANGRTLCQAIFLSSTYSKVSWSPSKEPG